MNIYNVKKIKCPLCGKAYVSKEAVYEHISREHSFEIPDGMPPDRFFYDMTHNGKRSHCIICKRPTPWNPRTHKYSRLCGRAECAAKNRKIFEERMMATHKMINMCADPEHQKKMLAARSISGIYKWIDGGSTPYVGSYEKDFLKNCCDIMLDFKADDIIGPSPNVYKYKYDGKEHFYIPDFYIPDLKLEVEIKDGGDNPNMHPKIQKIDKVKERCKDMVLCKQKDSNYIKIENKNYTQFIALVNKLSEDNLSTSEESNKIKVVPEIAELKNVK